jgi:hypothetical protein
MVEQPLRAVEQLMPQRAECPVSGVGDLVADERGSVLRHIIDKLEADPTGMRLDPPVLRPFPRAPHQCPRNRWAHELRTDLGQRLPIVWCEVNISRLLAPLDSPQFADFIAALDEVNAAGECAPGFRWRLQTEDGNATSIRAFEWDAGDSHGVIVNLTTCIGRGPGRVRLRRCPHADHASAQAVVREGRRRDHHAVVGARRSSTDDG